MAAGQVYRELGEAAWSWVLRQVREDDGPWLPEVVPEIGLPSAPGEDRDSVYAGIGGLAPVLAEISLSRAVSGAEQALAARIAARLTAAAPTRTDPSLYTGLAGDVTALKLLPPGRRAGGAGPACRPDDPRRMEHPPGDGDWVCRAGE